VTAEGDASRVWRTSVNELIALFRDSILALLPSLQKAQIPWRDIDAYDQWDEISETLYKVLVLDAIQWALNDHEMNVPRYGFKIDDYSSRSFIGVRSPAGERTAFQLLDANNDRFDMVACRELTADFRIVEGDALYVPLSQCDFSFQHFVSGSGFTSVSELLVP